MSAVRRICLIGCGEVDQVLRADLIGCKQATLSAWDPLFADPASGPSRALSSQPIRRGLNACDVIAGSDLVISAVTAAEGTAAALGAATALTENAIYLDLNSVSPGTKAAASRIVNDRGGRYVEAAVMAPIARKRIGVPMLLGGPYAEAFFLTSSHALGFVGAEVYSDIIGLASAAKMCRSVMIKGIESLLIESLVAARRYGVEDAVLESPSGLMPVGDWRALSRYMISRSLQHGKRRAEEMHEAAKTVADAGIDPWMSTACAKRQAWAGAQGASTLPLYLNAALDEIISNISEAHGPARC